MIARLALSAALLLGLAGTATARMQVEVTGAVGHPGPLELKDGARLSDAALAAEVQPHAYLLGAAWLRADRVVPQVRLKAGVLFDLGQLGIDALKHRQTALATTASGLRSRLARLPVTGRVPALLDPHAIQVTAADNWPLHPGDRLDFPLRPATISIVGAVQHPCTVPLEPLQDARRYLATCPDITRAADPDWLYVIQPDGRVFRQGVALWNRSAPMALAPGAVLYVPLDARAAHAIDPTLNHDIAAFLATQVLPGPGATP